MSAVSCGGDTPLAGNETCHIMAFHQPFNPFVVHDPAPPAQLCTYPRGTVCPPRLVPDDPDLVHQGGLGQLGRAGLGPLPIRVVSRRRHACHRTDEPYREPLGLLGVDEAIQRHSFDSLTQKTTARLFEFTLHPQPSVLPLQLPEPFPLPRREPLPLTTVDLVLAYPVAQRRVVGPQLVGDLTYRLARSCGRSLPRLSLELIRELSPRSFSSQQDSYPARCSHCRRRNALTVEMSG